MLSDFSKYGNKIKFSRGCTKEPNRMRMLTASLLLCFISFASTVLTHSNREKEGIIIKVKCVAASDWKIILAAFKTWNRLLFLPFNSHIFFRSITLNRLLANDIWWNVVWMAVPISAFWLYWMWLHHICRAAMPAVMAIQLTASVNQRKVISWNGQLELLQLHHVNFYSYSLHARIRPNLCFHSNERTNVNGYWVCWLAESCSAEIHLNAHMEYTHVIICDAMPIMAEDRTEKNNTKQNRRRTRNYRNDVEVFRSAAACISILKCCSR